MSKFEYRVFRCRCGWDGGDYYLEAMVQKNWVNANDLGTEGWEFITFVPNPETYLDAYEEEHRKIMNMAVFKRIVGA